MSETEDKTSGHETPQPVTTEHASAIFDQVTTAICILDTDGTIELANPAMAQLAGVDIARGKPFGLIVHPEDRDVFDNALRSAENPAIPLAAMSIRLQPENSGPVRAMISVSKLAGQQAQPRVVVAVQLIDGILNVLESLQKNETRWKYALESAYQGVWDHDFKTNEYFYSPTWRKLRGVAPDAPVDGSLEKWMEGVHPDDHAHVIASIRQQDEGEVAFNVFQYRERHADGHWVWIESRGSCIEWFPDGKPSRIIGTDTDITDHKRAEAQLAEVTRKMRLALDVSRIGVFDVNLDTGEIHWDERMMQIYGYRQTGKPQHASDMGKIRPPG